MAPVTRSATNATKAVSSMRQRDAERFKAVKEAKRSTEHPYFTRFKSALLSTAVITPAPVAAAPPARKRRNQQTEKEAQDSEMTTQPEVIKKETKSVGKKISRATSANSTGSVHKSNHTLKRKSEAIEEHEDVSAAIDTQISKKQKVTASSPDNTTVKRGSVSDSQDSAAKLEGSTRSVEHVQTSKKRKHADDSGFHDNLEAEGKGNISARKTKKMKSSKSDGDKVEAGETATSANMAITNPANQAKERAPEATSSSIIKASSPQAVVQSVPASLRPREADYVRKREGKPPVFEDPDLIEIIPRGQYETLVYQTDDAEWEVTWKKPADMEMDTTVATGPVFVRSRAQLAGQKTRHEMETLKYVMDDGLVWLVFREAPMESESELDDEDEDLDGYTSEESLEESENEEISMGSKDNGRTLQHSAPVVEDDAVSIKREVDQADEDDLPVIRSQAVRREDRKFRGKIFIYENAPGQPFRRYTCADLGNGSILEYFSTEPRKPKAGNQPTAESLAENIFNAAMNGMSDNEIFDAVHAFHFRPYTGAAPQSRAQITSS